MEVVIVGGGLAGCEAAWYLASHGLKVTLYEMRPHQTTPAHTTGYLAELVCSNSLKSESRDTSAGLLKAELRLYGSLLMEVADATRVPAGAALAVDREKFASLATNKIINHENITVLNELYCGFPPASTNEKCTIIAAGPLADSALTDKLNTVLGANLHFVDAISPVVSADSIDVDKAFYAGRYGKGGDDYLNLPMNQAEFDEFYEALISADIVRAHEFEDEKVFERCMPIEVIASRGKQTLLYGPMRPVGLITPTGERPAAIVQLRLENKERTAFNIVGFQTKMTIPAQQRVLRLIPGLANAEFLRYGTIHRNTYVNAPKCMNNAQQLKNYSNVYLAGQISGVEGYLESMASGMMAAMQIYSAYKYKRQIEFNPNTAFGALQRHISGEFGSEYVPGNFHFGMLPPLLERVRGKSLRKQKYAERAMQEWNLP